MANNIEGQLIDNWNKKEEHTGIKGWLEENISKKGIEKYIKSTEKDLNKVLFPAGKNIFGLETKPFTTRDLTNLVMGSVGGGPKSQASYLLRKIEDIRRGHAVDDLLQYVNLKKMTDRWFKSREFDEIAKKQGIKFSKERRDPWATESKLFEPWRGGKKRPGGRRKTDPPKEDPMDIW
jgi:hypothetical protein